MRRMNESMKQQYTWKNNSFGCEVWATKELVPEIFQRLIYETQQNMCKQKKTFYIDRQKWKRKKIFWNRPFNNNRIALDFHNILMRAKKRGRIASL